MVKISKARDNATQGGLVLIAKESFTGASTVSINNCFTSRYLNYKIIISTTPSTSSYPQMRLRSGGTDATSGVYLRRQAYFGSSGTVSSYYGYGNESLWYIYNYAGTGVFHTVCEMNSPAVATYTRMSCEMNSGGNYYENGTFVHQANTAYDGFTVFHSGGTITGTIEVYGYMN